MAKKMNKTEIRQSYRTLYAELEEILFRCDPIGINLVENRDEYDPEVSTIPPRLKEARSESDVHNIIYEEFQQWWNYNK
jgi:hypothetical protein